MVFSRGPKQGDRVLTRDGTEIGTVARTERKALEVQGPESKLRFSRQYVDKRSKGDTILNITDAEIDSLAPHEGGRSPLLAVPVLAAAAGGAFALTQKDRILKELKSRKQAAQVESHSHEAMVHQHEHVHVTHNRRDFARGVGGWEHLTASHSHTHNHAPLTHTHRPHRDMAAEHAREAHIHDHNEPEG